MSSAIFISYRRKESIAPARALFERLRSELGPGRVFIDLEGLDYGVDFVEVLEQHLANCKVMLALIGPDWLGTDPSDGSRRIDDDNDFVRIELQTALRRKIRVVPVLLDGAKMPSAAALPEDVRSLVRRQALELDFRSFDADVGRLIGTLKKILDPPAIDTETQTKAPAAAPAPRTIDHETSAPPQPVRQSAPQGLWTLPDSYAAAETAAGPATVRAEANPRRPGYRESDIEAPAGGIGLDGASSRWHEHKPAIAAVVVIAILIAAVVMLNPARTPTPTDNGPRWPDEGIPAATAPAPTGDVPPAGPGGDKNAAAEPTGASKAFDATVAPSAIVTSKSPSPAASDAAAAAAMRAAAAAAAAVMDATSSAKR